MRTFILTLTLTSIGLSVFSQDKCKYCEDLKYKSRYEYDISASKKYNKKCFINVKTFYKDSVITTNIKSATKYILNSKDICNTYFSTHTFDIKLNKIISGYYISNNDTGYFVTDNEQDSINVTNDLMNYVKKNIVYPSICLRYGIEGAVYISFVLNELGQVTEIYPIGLGDPDILLIKEAIRVIKAFPSWTPFKYHGRPVKVTFNIPIKFMLK